MVREDFKQGNEDVTKGDGIMLVRHMSGTDDNLRYAALKAIIKDKLCLKMTVELAGRLYCPKVLSNVLEYDDKLLNEDHMDR